ncbi:MAG: hypothetical protein ACLTI1_06640 [Clostridia bacterium]
MNKNFTKYRDARHVLKELDLPFEKVAEPEKRTEAAKSTKKPLRQGTGSVMKKKEKDILRG